MASSSSGIVAGLTAGALAVVGFLAYQASANAPDSVAAPSSSTSPAQPGAKEKAPQRSPLELPAESGKGSRVVYSLSGKRIWLVDTEAKAGTKPPTFVVAPSAVSPTPDTYLVMSRSIRITGSDGKPVEHVVRFANVDGVTIGFSAAVDGTMPTPGTKPQEGTGAVRLSREDGAKVWEFATRGVKVVVVP
ncbi:hypothetical protein OG897_25455 [Streptomyces sp. NBC_00237]|uniref:hypothetical protein n=1 Tax=Streptomyces sp. NBC_00237 TaxID=2975687 RepID=UPI00224CA1DC|nr:hypothetical protein [Streptomyces sp. NBC_00237]MCX5204790.1 hypothetical protein [Streptomyces sp. NBC_00237]